MGVYGDHVLPRIIEVACGLKTHDPHRERVCAGLEGEVVEIGAQLADGSSQTIRAEYLLVATGRGPVTDGLDIERLGVELSKGYVKVDGAYRTNVPGVSAIGDVIALESGAHPQLAHVSSAEGIIAAERIASQPPPR